MTKENKELMEKVKYIDEISDSQRDRIESQNLALNELVSFLKCQMEKVEAKSSLRNTVIGKLNDRIASEDDRISTSHLLQLFQILSKDENDAIANILSVVKDKQNTVINIPNEGSGRKDSHLSSEEVDRTKKLLNILDLVDKLKGSEMSIDELEDKSNLK